MQNKNISNIVKSFEPIKIPIVRGREALNRLKDDSFPIYVTSMKEGLEIVIREGSVYMTEWPYVILNPHFKTKFKTLIELTKSRGFTVHATLFNNDLTEEQLYKLLLSSEKLLPNDLQLYVTMVIYEKSISEMLYKNITELVRAFFGTKANPFIPNTVPAYYVEVKSKNNLVELTDFLLTQVKHNKGVLLLHKFGFYKQGNFPLEGTHAVVLEPTEDIFGTVVKVVTSTKFLPGETLTMADKLLIRFGGIELTYDLVDHPLAFRGMLSDLRQHLVGSKVLCELLYLPGTNEVKIKQVKRFLFESE